MSLYQPGVILKALLENPELINPPKPTQDGEKKKEDELDNLFAGHSAFLGPTDLWDKTLAYDGSDFKLEYMDIDRFFEENGISSGDPNEAPEVPSTPVKQVSEPIPCRYTPDSTPTKPVVVKSDIQESVSPTSPDGRETDQVFKSVVSKVDPLSPGVGKNFDGDADEADDDDDEDGETSDLYLAQLPGERSFDPRKRQFTEDELRPQPMIKKSRKIFVPDEMKDDRYWCRRKKNNVAAKRSRDARRIKENQIALRASFLEKTNEQLELDNENLKIENKSLKERLAKYESV